MNCGAIFGDIALENADKGLPCQGCACRIEMPDILCALFFRIFLRGEVVVGKNVTQPYHGQSCTGILQLFLEVF